MTLNKLDTKAVMARLEAMHDPTRWAFFDEMRIGTGYGKDSEQRMDGWAIHYFPSKRNVVRCYEIKVSRGDFKVEISKPKKRRAGLRLSNEFYFVTPKDLVKTEEVPVECGLMEVDEQNNIETIIKAPYRETIPPTWLFLSAICRRLDIKRLREYMHNLEEDKKLETYGHLSMEVVKEHVERWKAFKDGNKEVPDQIAKALEDVYFDIEEAIDLNKKIK